MRTFKITFKNLSLVGSLSLIVAVGCSESSTTPDAEKSPPANSDVMLVNAVCPVEGGKASPDVTVEWNGKTVGFCCAECISAWNELSDDEKAAKLAAGGSEATSDHEHDHGEEHDDASHDAT